MYDIVKNSFINLQIFKLAFRSKYKNIYDIPNNLFGKYTNLNHNTNPCII